MPRQEVVVRPEPGRIKGRPTVLLVEDEPDVRESLQDVLHASVTNVQVVAVASGEEARNVLASQYVDLVVSDYKLPGMDGLTLLLEARHLAPHAGRLLITGFADLEVPEASLEAAHLEAVVTKPLEVEHLVACVLAALRKGPAVAGPAVAGRNVRDG